MPSALAPTSLIKRVFRCCPDCGGEGQFERPFREPVKCRTCDGQGDCYQDVLITPAELRRSPALLAALRQIVMAAEVSRG